LVSFVSLLFLASIAYARDSATVTLERVNAPTATVVYFANGQDCTARAPLAGGDGRLKEGEPVSIAAGREVAFWMRQAREEQAHGSMRVAEACDAVISFVPESGVRYQLTYRVSPDGMRCGASLARLVTDAIGVRAMAEPTFRRRSPLYAESADLPACLPAGKR